MSAPPDGPSSPRTAVPVLVAAGLILGALGAWLTPRTPGPPARDAGPRPDGWFVPRHLRLVWTESPASEVTVLWTTNAPGASTVYLADVPRGGAVELYPTSHACDSAAPYPGATDYVHRCQLRGLKPSTRYFFVPSTRGRHGAENWFVTAPDDDRPFRILFGGDSRSDRTQRQRMNRTMARLLEADEGILALAHGGDYVANGSRWHHWQAWLRDHQLTTTRDARLLPIIPTRGNHEGIGRLFAAVFGLSRNGHYFLTRIGAFRLITLNTEASLAGDQRNWLESTLEREAAQARWLVVQYHRAAFPAVKQPSLARQHWVPLFEKYNVDLAVESDGHALKRTVPIRNKRKDRSGVTYVGEGGLGVAQRRPDATRWYFKDGGMVASHSHVQVVAVSSSALRYRAVAADGRTLDRAQLAVRPGRAQR